MKKRLLLAVAVIMVLCGWLSAFTLNDTSPQGTWKILLPTLLLGIGMAILHKNSGWKKTALTVLLTALTALLIMNQFFPDLRVTVATVKQRFQNRQAGTMVTVTVNDSDRLNTFVPARVLESFAPVDIHLFAQLPGAVRMLTTDTKGHIYATIPSLGAIYRLRDDDGDGFADESILYHVGMDRPHGIIWDDDKLYVAEPSQLLELRDTNHDNQVDQVRVIVGGLPDDGGHWARSIVQGNDGFIYLAVGSRCNACEEKHPQRATVLKVNPVTGKTVIFARGLRNTIGLAFAPDGDILWGTDIGRTGLRGQLPPDEINQISVAGDYGWPFCYGQQLVDPAFVAADRCANTVASSIDLAAGSGPMGITFGAGLNAPEPYRNSLYVALHGSADDGSVTSGKLIRIPYQEQNIDRHGEEFLRGLQVTGNSWWTPVAVIVGIDGHLYVSDDQAQAIYRIRWQQAE